MFKTTQMFKNKIHTTLDLMFQNGEITKRKLDFLKIKNPVISTFYTLPKIHKRLESPPGRPIVAGIGSLTSSISTFVDFFIRPYCEKMPSFLKDTTHMLSFIDSINPVTEDILLVSFDVQSLYTCIPHKEGIDSMINFLSERVDSVPSNECIETLSEIVLSHNYFIFQNNFFYSKTWCGYG